MKLESRAFGSLEYAEEAVIELEEGMLGFAAHKRYILIENDEIAPFKWLQAIDDEYVAFPVLDPRLVVPGYEKSIPRYELESLGLAQPQDVVTLAVAIIPEDPRKSLVNLKAPILIHPIRRHGKQVVLTHSHFSTLHPLWTDEELPGQVG